MTAESREKPSKSQRDDFLWKKVWWIREKSLNLPTNVNITLTIMSGNRLQAWAVALLSLLLALVVTACGDEEKAAAEYEVNIVGVLPQMVAPFVQLELTYNNAQGQTVTVVVKDGDKSDAVPSYVSQQAMLMTLGFVDFSKCTVRHIRFMASEDSKVVCRYKTVVNGKSVTSVSEGSCHQPFAFVMAREQASGSLVLPSTINATSSQVSSADQLERLLSRWAATEGESSIQL